MSFVHLFRRYLRDQGLPVTQQREAIAEVVFGASEHLSVEDIENRLREGGERIGKATIYRTLEMLVKSGLVEEHDFSTLDSGRPASASVEPLPPRHLGRLPLHDRLEILRTKVERRENIVVEHPEAAAGQGPGSQLFLARDAQLANDEHIQLQLQNSRDFEADRHAAARQRQDEGVLADLRRQQRRQPTPRVVPIHESPHAPKSRGDARGPATSMGRGAAHPRSS